MTLHLLDNIVWHALAGPHARFSAGTDAARRYAPGFSPIVGFADAACPDFGALAAYCEPGQHFYCGGWSGPGPAGWQIHTDATMDQMVWDAAVPAAGPEVDAVRLGPEHAAQMLELVGLTHPGPFGPRTAELGEYSRCASFRARRSGAITSRRKSDRREPLRSSSPRPSRRGSSPACWGRTSC